MSGKFDEFKKERQEQKKVIEELRGEVSSLNEKLNCFTEKLDQQEQHSAGGFPTIALLKISKTGSFINSFEQTQNVPLISLNDGYSM